MSSHEKFHFDSLKQLRDKIDALHVSIDLAEDLSPLKKPVRVGGKTAPNAIAVLPMEGCDSNADGSPSELVERRYLRFAGGGAGLLWWEACAVAEEGRANELQMMLTRDNLGQFANLLAKTNAEAANRNGADHRPVNILQLTHSGRYSRPHGHKPAPLVPQHDPYLDPRVGLAPDAPVVTDAYLDDLIGRYAQSAKMAKEAGFDGVDLKSCHRYLLSELLASHTREGKYGGSFENRTRFLREVIDAVRRETGEGMIIACRFNVFDAHPYPYGFGEDQHDFWTFDPTEPMALVRMLCERGVGLLSNSAGNPYYIYPQVTRPFDSSSMGIPVPDEHPLESVARLFAFTRSIQREAGNVPVVGNGYSWLRQFAPNAGAANLASGSCSFMGLGRSSFAYTDAPRDL
ncbi:MAG TPA: NADH:flavin oxidoreductase, partial [Candidatus Limiplasma sp.]|nr:NADH:flavin oxidoreductase [Candidatus Limiplasma sp.]